MKLDTGWLVVVATIVCAACGGGGGGGGGGTSTGSSASTNPNPNTNANAGPAAGYALGAYPVPAEAQAEDVSSPDRVVGTGTAASCTADAFIQAVAQGGKIVFNCGTDPVTITLNRPAKVFNDRPDIVIDGGGLVTLSGGGNTRILYMNTCDPAQVWTTSHCQDQAQPRLTVQNLAFVDGNSTNEATYDGGGAIWVRGGRFKVVNSRFFNNVCASTGPDVGGGAIRVFDQYQDQPVYVVNSTFGGASGYGNVGANGGAISSIGVSWSIYNSVFSYNKAVGNGGNPAQTGTPGGGSGGAIYNDGNTMTLALYGTLIEHNEVNAYGSAIFSSSTRRSATTSAAPGTPCPASPCTATPHARSSTRRSSSRRHSLECALSIGRKAFHGRSQPACTVRRHRHDPGRRGGDDQGRREEDRRRPRR